MKRLLLLALLVCCTWSARAQDVVVRSKIEPRNGAVVGQHVRVMVDVLFRGGMPRPPRVVIGDISGAQILRIETQATTMSDRIGGQPYDGQRFEFALYARRGGTIVVPAAKVTLLDAKGDEAGTASGEELRAEISVPPGVDPSGPVIASASVTLEEQWTPSPATPLKAGDALVRTIIRTVDDVPAMAMRELDFPAPPGVRVYRDPPQAEDRQDRGSLVGHRTDRVTYVFEAGGAVKIAGVSQPWWKLDGGGLQQARGAGVSVSVMAAAKARNWPLIGSIAAVAVALIGVLGWWLAPRLHSAWRTDRQRWAQSERKAFRDLSSATNRHDVAAIYRAFVIWRRRGMDDPAVAPLAEELERALFGGSERRSWSSAECAAFSRKLGVARRQVLAEARSLKKPQALPPLNPSNPDMRAGTAFGV